MGSLSKGKRQAWFAALAALTGLLAGAASTAFLYLLEFVTRAREASPAWIYALPALGFLVAMAYERFGGSAGRGQHLLIDEIHEPKEAVPLRTAPLVLVGTLLTHLGGGSAGREGTAVQMGGSLAEGVARFFRVNAEERRALLMAGLGAGFGGAVGAPLAGIVFGLEVISSGGWDKFRSRAWGASIVASAFSYLTAKLLHAPHSVYPRPLLEAFSLRTVFLVCLAGLAFGLAARAFSFLAHGVERWQKRFVGYAPLRPVIGGLLVIGLFTALGTLRYAGLGIPVIQGALREVASPFDPGLKALLTALTVGSGFKGGEFIPLVFIGTTLGSALSVVLPIPLPLLASVGFSAVFGAAANTPLACAIMGAELFGVGIFPYALAAGLIAYLSSGPRGVYPAQRIGRPKGQLFRRALARMRRERTD